MTYRGLTTAEAEASRRIHGANVLPEPARLTFGQAFLETFRDPMIRILLVMVALMVTMYFVGYAEIYEPVGTIVTVLIVATVTARTSLTSDDEYHALRARTAKDRAKLRRDGGLHVLPVDEIVVGDLVILQGGDKIPADGVLISGDLRVSNAALNGETEECHKRADAAAVFPEKTTGDTFVDGTTLFRGSVVFDGEGILQVCRVGTATMMGQMASEMQAREPASPLQVKLAKLADQISAFGYISGIVIVALYMMFFALRAGGIEAYVLLGWGQVLVDVIEAVSLAILIIVCAVPEGLPLMISIVLMQNTSRMLSRGVLVRRAVGIETAGALNILFSDKTGTITGGRLSVVEFFTADGTVYGADLLAGETVLAAQLRRAIGRNTASMYDESGAVVGGNPTDQAVMYALGEKNCRALQADETSQAGQRQTFNSVNKFSQAELPARGIVVYKGAPEVLLARAQYALDAAGNVVPYDADALTETINAYAARAMRVLAFGYSASAFHTNEVNADTVLIGFAMGSGTEAARDAGDIVILDDNFRSIKDAILYGRTIYNNILKFCRFQLVINIAAVVVSAFAPFFGIMEPLRVTHLLFINLVMDSLGAIMLGNEPAHESYMHEKPRRRDASIISPAMAAQILWMGTWLVLLSFAFLTQPIFAACFAGQAEQYTAYFLLFVLASLMNGFNVRSSGFGIFRDLGANPGFLRVWGGIVLIMAAIINAPLLPHEIGAWIGAMFSCTPIHPGGWVLAFLLAATMLPVDLLRKAMVRALR